ncbi:MAG: methyltransferase domain-containing protein [Acidobacteriia bacterium]|nr:methyltransferase domain-containing protein [Terriglobia bacterium]
MLKTVLHRLRCPACAGSLAADAIRQTDARILDGALRCGGCGAVFAIENGLLDLTPPALAGPQLAQRRHFDWFADNDTQSYTAYQASPFWVAEDGLTFDAWRARIDAGAWVLDVGCANGRSAWPLLSRGGVVVGCDISPKLVRQAIARAEADGVADRTCFFVADCDRLPFADCSFRYVLTYGVLHHLPDPARACREIQRVLEPGGVHFGSENNRTVFRRLFDLLMRWRPLWIEEAGAEPLISEGMLREWLRDLPVRLECTTSVFLPPHVMNVAGHASARSLLRLSDCIGRAIPGLRGQGGLIVFDARKTAA